ARERRLLLGRRLRRARHPTRLLHVDLRGGTRGGKVRARDGAVRRQPAHPSARRLHGTVAANASRGLSGAPLAPSTARYRDGGVVVGGAPGVGGRAGPCSVRVTTPHATRGPEFPDGSVVKSSALA